MIESDLASALAKAQKTLILNAHKLRTNTPGYSTAVEWADLSNERNRIVWRNSAGQVTRVTSRTACQAAPGGQPCQVTPQGACGCDLNPFTNFPSTQELRVALLAQQPIDGKPTFHLRMTPIGGHYASDVTDIWIDRITFLPVREKLIAPKTKYNPKRYTVTNDFRWLPRTSANLAQLGS